MKWIFLIAAFWCGRILAQTVPVADTSFTVYSAFDKAIKKYGGISIATEKYFPQVQKDSNLLYCITNGRPLYLDVFSNKKNNNGIGIVILHGGGWRSGHRSMHHPLAQQLAALGYTCFTPGYRLSAEAIFPAAVLDVKSALRWAKQYMHHQNLDSSKMVVLGFSAGGELAAFAAVTGNFFVADDRHCTPGSSASVQALIDIDGTLSFVHPESSEGDDSKRLSAATQWLGVSKSENFGLWEEASPLLYVGKDAPPALFLNSSVAAMHAGRDSFINVLNRHQTYSEVHVFENSPHTFCLFHPWFDPMVNYIDAFLKRVFKH